MCRTGKVEEHKEYTTWVGSIVNGVYWLSSIQLEALHGPPPPLPIPMMLTILSWKSNSHTAPNSRVACRLSEMREIYLCKKIVIKDKISWWNICTFSLESNLLKINNFIEVILPTYRFISSVKCYIPPTTQRYSFNSSTYSTTVLHPSQMAHFIQSFL